MENDRGTAEEPDEPKRYLRVLLVLGLLLGLWLHCRGISEPAYDSHNFRQCQTLSTIEEYYRSGIDLLYPKSLWTGYPGVFVLELPLFQAMAAGLYHVFGPHLEVIRWFNILWGALATWLVYALGVRYLSRMVGVMAALIYWLAPLNVLFQRSMLLDP